MLAAKALSEPFLTPAPMVTISTLHGWRYPTFLLHLLTKAAVVGVNWRDISTAARMLPPRVFWRRIRIANLLPAKKRGVLIQDEANDRGMRAERRIALEKRYYSAPREPGLFVLPYFASPQFYEDDFAPLARELATRPRRRSMTLFFSGTVDDEHYAAAARFSILTRPPIIDRLQRGLEKPDAAGLRDRVEINLQHDVSQTEIKHRFTLPEYLARLADADFTLCPPGCGMPHSHNIVEAMAVGTIPITNYAGHMVPPLTHGVDCLAFDTLDELDVIISSLMTIDQASIERMRRAVIDYYDRHLDPAAVGARLVANLDHIDKIAVNDETGR